MTPRTSVVMPVRDGQVYIEEAIDSVLRQLSRDDEILVVDDASADNTRLILARIQDPRPPWRRQPAPTLRFSTTMICGQRDAMRRWCRR